MSQGIGVVGVYVRDQEEALQFYVGKLGFRAHTDVKNGDYRWLTVQHPDQADRPLWHGGRGLPRSVGQWVEGDPSARCQMSTGIRLVHRWVSILFTLTVIANFVALSQGGTPAAWITYSPLAILMFSGLYLFALPYTLRWRKRVSMGARS